MNRDRRGTDMTNRYVTQERTTCLHQTELGIFTGKRQTKLSVFNWALINRSYCHVRMFRHFRFVLTWYILHKYHSSPFMGVFKYHNLRTITSYHICSTGCSWRQVLIYCERKVLLIGWWLALIWRERKVLLLTTSRTEWTFFPCVPDADGAKSHQNSTLRGHLAP